MPILKMLFCATAWMLCDEVLKRLCPQRLSVDVHRLVSLRVSLATTEVTRGQAMERLKILLLVATFVSTGQFSEAQQIPTETPFRNAVGLTPSYTVIGDVRDPRTVAIPEERLTIRSAVLQAQPFASPVSVSVLRRTQDRVVWTQLISADSADTGEFVVPGDVLIVQAINGLQAPVRQNAALRTDSGVLVVLLSDESVTIGDILQQTVGLPAANQEVSISSRFQGRPTAAKVTLPSVVAHGDVINLGQSSQKVLKGFGSIAPAFSEWKSEVLPVTLTTPEPTSRVSDVVFDAPSYVPADVLSDVNEQTETAESVDDSPASGDDTETAEEITEIPVQPASHSTVTDTSTLEEAAPNPPLTQTTVSAEQSPAGGLNFWNVVVIGGLIVAGILLLAGSLSEEDDAEVLQQSATRIPKRTIRMEKSKPQTSPDMSATESHQASSSLSAEMPSSDLKFASMEKPAESNPTYSVRITRPEAMNSQSLVKPTEWFSTEWRQKPEEPSAAEARVLRDSTSQIKAIEHAVQIPTVPDEAERLPNSKISVAEAERMENLVRSIVAEGRKNAETARQPSVVSTDFSDLEDLLQNRLPVDLLQAQLPLRISLFGRPAGPRRIRIDASHASLSGPHTHLNSARRQEVGMTEAASKSESWRLDSLTQDEGLDRALNSLQDRTNS